MQSTSTNYKMLHKIPLMCVSYECSVLRMCMCILVTHLGAVAVEDYICAPNGNTCPM